MTKFIPLLAVLFFLTSVIAPIWAEENVVATPASQEFSSPQAQALELAVKPTQQPLAFEVVDQHGELVIRFQGLREQSKILVWGEQAHIHFLEGFAPVEMRALSYRDFSPVPVASFAFPEVTLPSSLKEQLYQQVKNHTSLGYRPARERMFSELDNENGYVECVYTGIRIQTKSIPNHTIMNTEHTWPKSQGASSEPAKSDIHHLFPTDSYTNSKRSSYPFGEVREVYWHKGGSLLGENQSGQIVFSPRSNHRGDVARAMFYFAVRYRISIPEFEEQILRSWHQADPVSQKERSRNDGISKYQRKRNPFIDHPQFVEQIADF